MYSIWVIIMGKEHLKKTRTLLSKNQNPSLKKQVLSIVKEKKVV